MVRPGSCHQLIPPAFRHTFLSPKTPAGDRLFGNRLTGATRGSTLPLLLRQAGRLYGYQAYERVLL
jgi:hypothetical protein